jgi:hypothetical protein
MNNIAIDETRWYKRGVRLAELWIEAGGSLDSDGPNTHHEPFYNGFIDTINKEREKTIDNDQHIPTFLLPYLR